MKVELNGSLLARNVAEVPPAAPAHEVSWGLVVAYVLIGNVMLGLGFIIVWAATSRAPTSRWVRHPICDRLAAVLRAAPAIGRSPAAARR